MQLTQFTDYALRVLIYCGHKKGLATVDEIAGAFQISRNHLVKVVHRLGRLKLIRTFKGRSGGFELSVDPYEVKLGDLIVSLEPNMTLVECFDHKRNTCPIIGVCDLERLLYEARKSFVETLNSHTLGDLFKSPLKAQKMARLSLTQ